VPLGAPGVVLFSRKHTCQVRLWGSGSALHMYVCRCTHAIACRRTCPAVHKVHMGLVVGAARRTWGSPSAPGLVGAPPLATGALAAFQTQLQAHFQPDRRATDWDAFRSALCASRGAAAGTQICGGGRHAWAWAWVPVPNGSMAGCRITPVLVFWT
jgi:hypothetical protein